MSSLQEQLLKAGLVDENRLKQANKEKNRRNKQARKTSTKAGARKPDAKTLAAQKRQAERVERDRALEAKRKQALEQKSIAAQVRQMIDSNRIDRGGGDIAYSFVYRKKIKKMYVNEAEKKGLSDGRLAIVTLVINHEGRRFELVPMEVARKIAERDPDTVIELNLRDDSASDEDDPYADYKIPDDLTW